MKKMLNKKEIFIATIVVILIILIYIIYFVVNNKEARNGYNSPDDIITAPKKYDVNEYYSLSISNEQMASIYLNDFLFIARTNPDEAYLLLDEEYRNKKFGDVNNFILYVNNNYLKNISVNEYAFNFNKYYIYDDFGNTFVFVIKSVMEYKVYLDENTVEITNY